MKIFTAASEETEGYLRYIRSASYYDIEVSILLLVDKRVILIGNIPLFCVERYFQISLLYTEAAAEKLSNIKFSILFLFLLSLG